MTNDKHKTEWAAHFTTEQAAANAAVGRGVVEFNELMSCWFVRLPDGKLLPEGFNE